MRVDKPAGLVVLWANWDSVLHLFRGLPVSIPRLMVRVSNVSLARNLGWPWLGDPSPLPDGEGQWLSRYVFPPGWHSILGPILGRLMVIRVKRDCSRVNIRPDTLCLVQPMPGWETVRQRLGAKHLLYYCVDDYRAMRPERSSRIEALEDAIVRQADRVVCASRFMQQELIRRNPAATARIVHVSNGVDASFLVPSPLKMPDPLPVDVSHLRRPVLGYLGGMEGRIDWPLLIRVVQSIPDCSLLMIGPLPRLGTEDAVWMERLKSNQTVCFAGPRPQSRIMEYIRAFDVCLIPEPLRPLNIAGCPQKLWNYLASSRPVVSTAVPEQMLHEPLVLVGRSHAEFVERISGALHSAGDEALARQRLELARVHTWKSLSGRLVDHLKTFGILPSDKG
ncbi:MAG: hypothetical protein A2498_09310 [Lentisphaerae bacterium RIFOXYC12_FULL_60_16]|nr:MAG: hypothetical protein A2498_09310 [Lentisphaerae bacterium RIFOXYC12_FULL_60_16]